ncbi:rhomboid family intramembrane serine protease [Lysobacter helvus]|uniref:Rhomboid family intramembrane serine protease n=2 Tax=Lysobacteraceae TaxID=32033 RepID=A0ABM7Q708_9GAMM|nr:MULTISPECIES: rhomboid family intramembrane serine protease [Lysobacter]BCT93052.1 rhomboid family intramembrane serine protease [Lysobacter caseinilyticus]BCT96204.1 rhomboid family intramembrane serine protease [Lysobacter helvus]
MASRFPPVTKLLLIANIAIYALEWFLRDSPILDSLALWPIGAEQLGAPPFMPWQLVTYAFLHDPSSPTHLLFNMFALWMFGAPLEETWGSRRHAAYYAICIVGAGVLQLVVGWWQLQHGAQIGPAIGASGGVFGLLLAYGMLFPNNRVMLIIPPIPMKARTFVVLYGLGELFLGVSGFQPGVAHFAHLGGMLFGWLTIRYWRGQPPFGRPKPRING